MTEQQATSIVETSAPAPAAATTEKKTKKPAAENGPSMLSFKHVLSPRHFFMFSAAAKDVFSSRLPVTVREEPIRGLNATMKTPEEKKSEAILQVIQTAELAPNHDTLVLSGSVHFNSVFDTYYACNLAEFKNKHTKVLETAIKKGVVAELARRYAVQIAAAKWSWRNLTESTEVVVKVDCDAKNLHLAFKNFDLSTADPFNFDNPAYTSFKDELQELAKAIEDAFLSTSARGMRLEIEGFFNMGSGARVFASQEWASESERRESKKEWEGGEGVTRFLASAMMDGQTIAFINDRKVGNALRCIDTWYGGSKPIAVEAYGGNSHDAVAYRPGKDLSIFGAVQQVWAGKELSETMLPFYVACAIRGGVFGVKD